MASRPRRQSWVPSCEADRRDRAGRNGPGGDARLARRPTSTGGVHLRGGRSADARAARGSARHGQGGHVDHAGASGRVGPSSRIAGRRRDGVAVADGAVEPRGGRAHRGVLARPSATRASRATCSPVITTTICSSRSIGPTMRSRRCASVRAEVVGREGEPAQATRLAAQHVVPQSRRAGRRTRRRSRRRGPAMRPPRSPVRAGRRPSRRSRGTPGPRRRAAATIAGSADRSVDATSPLIGVSRSVGSLSSCLRGRHRNHRVRVDRAAGEDRRRCGLEVDPAVEWLGERFVGRSIQDQADGAVLVVFEDVHDRAVEVRVCQRRRGQQQASLRLR